MPEVGSGQDGAGCRAGGGWRAAVHGGGADADRNYRRGVRNMKVIVAAMLIASPASAEPFCATTTVIHEALSRQYGETRAMVGLQDDGLIVEFWRNGATGTWSAVITSPGGQSCIVAAGGKHSVTIGEAA